MTDGTHEQEPISELFSEVFDLADQMADRITDEDVQTELFRILAAGGQGRDEVCETGAPHGPADAARQRFAELPDTVDFGPEWIRSQAWDAAARARAAGIVDDAKRRSEEITAEAEKTADEYRDQALIRAAEIIGDARAEADRIITDAHSSAERIKATARNASAQRPFISARASDVSMIPPSDDIAAVSNVWRALLVAEDPHEPTRWVLKLDAGGARGSVAALADAVRSLQGRLRQFYRRRPAWAEDECRTGNMHIVALTYASMAGLPRSGSENPLPAHLPSCDALVVYPEIAGGLTFAPGNGRELGQRASLEDIEG